jgi:hypothetical protein
MTLAEINRMIRAAIRAARQEGAPVVEVKIGDDATVRIPLAPDKPIAEPDEVPAAGRPPWGLGPGESASARSVGVA